MNVQALPPARLFNRNLVVFRRQQPAAAPRVSDAPHREQHRFVIAIVLRQMSYASIKACCFAGFSLRDTAWLAIVDIQSMQKCNEASTAVINA